MNKLYLSIKMRIAATLVCSLVYFQTQAQSVTGILGTISSGNNNNGSVYFVKTDGTDYAQLYKAEIIASDGKNPLGNGLVAGPDGFLYGSTKEGGYDGYGSIFKIKPDGSEYEQVYEFAYYRDGAYPYNNMYLASDGNLYGITFYGGKNQNGTIFRYSFTAGFKKLYDFPSDGPRDTYGSFVEGPDGYLYAISNQGGKYDHGTLFKISKDGQDFKILHDFQNIDNQPSSPYFNDVVFIGNTILGIAYGGTQFEGAIYQINTDGSNFQKIFDFDNYYVYGANSYTPLFKASDGYIYGTTNDGGDYDAGTIFRFHPNSIVPNTTTGLNTLTGFTKILDFYYDIGSDPDAANFIEASNGYVYGVTENGGEFNEGVIYRFRLADVSNTTVDGVGTITGFETVASVKGYTYGTLHEYQGKIFGLTNIGGSSGNGSIFSIGLGTTSGVNTLYSFYPITTRYFRSGLVQHTDGYKYGTANTIDGGEIFKMDESGKITSLKVLENFTDDGWDVWGDIVIVNNKLYGTTFQGGTNSNGVLYEYDIASSNYRVIRNFENSTGRNPYGGVTYINDTLVGVSLSYGASNNYGAIQLLSIPTNSTATSEVVYSKTDFDNTTGRYIEAGMVYNPSLDALFGTTMYEGLYYSGTLFAITTVGTNPTFVKLADFSLTANGAGYKNKMVFDNNNILFGSASSGGTLNIGTIFKFDPSTTTGLVKIKDFNYDLDDLGREPFRTALNLGPDGFIYGNTRFSGQFNRGTLFKFDPNVNTNAGHDFTIVYAYKASDGYEKYGSLLFSTACINAPSITSEATSSTLCEGLNTSFRPVTSGFVSSYTWYKNNTTLAGANASILGLNSISATNAGTYYLQASGPCGVAQSKEYSLAVKPKFTLENSTVTSLVVCEYTPIEIPLSISGTIQSISWYKDGEDLGLSRNILRLNAVAAADTGSYTALIVGECNTIETPAVSISLQDAEICNPTSVKSGLASSFNIYPNPNAGRFTIATSGKGVLNIISASGSVVKSYTLSGNGETITVEGLSSGIYVAKLGAETVKVVVE